MSLIVDKIKCLEESDENGADDIYLITFRGRTLAPFESNLGSLGPGAAWSDFDTGETHGTDVGIAKTFSDAVYAVMMVEKDNGKDISGDAVVGAWKAQTDLVWKSVMLGLTQSGVNTSSAEGRAAGFTAIRNALNGLSSIYMEFPKGDDDVIDVQRITITAPGQTQTVRFRSPSHLEDATYDVTFKHA